jgi:hypothetical protein
VLVSGSTGGDVDPLGVFSDIEFITAYAAAEGHDHVFFGSGDGSISTDEQDATHAHPITALAFTDASNDHVHPLDEIESGPVVASPVAIDISTLGISLSGFGFTSTAHAHHHAIDITGSSTGDATNSSGEAAAPHHHTYEGTTDDEVQSSDFFCTVAATADADAQPAHEALMGYISL